ncbi:MAG: TIGR03986 family type III CRISPR-associated RAMP protein, partial [Chloroflexota bacterium]
TFRGGPDYTPPWPPQQQPCFVRCEPGKNTVAAICLDATPPAGDWLPGTLVLTGNAPKKKREFVFLAPSAESAVRVPPHVWERFHDDDQLTQWQERAFPPNQPTAQARKKKGWLREGEPVFFLCEERMRDTANPDALAFLGRAQMFRLPYDRTPEELRPKELWPADLDLAEAMFGVVERGAGGRDGRIIRGRLRFEDAVAQRTRADWLEPELIPHILSAPEVTAFAHYLTQDGRQQKDQLTTYIDDDQTTLRGHKWYWHRWDAGSATGGIAQVRHPQSDQLLPRLRDGGPGMTQLTAIRPVKAGVEFSTRVSFDNLSAVELGALVSALSLPEGCAHKLGMGKPLGLGSVRLVPLLYLVDRPTRYRTWADSEARSGGEEAYATAFAEAILAHACSSGETLLAGRSGLWRIARLETLRLLLQQGAAATGDGNTATAAQGLHLAPCAAHPVCRPGLAGAALERRAAARCLGAGAAAESPPQQPCSAEAIRLRGGGSEDCRDGHAAARATSQQGRQGTLARSGTADEQRQASVPVGGRRHNRLPA